MLVLLPVPTTLPVRVHVLRWHDPLCSLSATKSHLLAPAETTHYHQPLREEADLKTPSTSPLCSPDDGIRRPFSVSITTFNSTLVLPTSSPPPPRPFDSRCGEQQSAPEVKETTTKTCGVIKRETHTSVKCQGASWPRSGRPTLGRTGAEMTGLTNLQRRMKRTRRRRK